MGNDKFLIDIIIDKFTLCLEDKRTGEIFDTIIEPMTISASRKRLDKWKFDWHKETNPFALKLKGSSEIQGLILLEDDERERAIYVKMVESNPKNVGQSGKYYGVGPHLFAFACFEAKQRGYDYIYFDAKTELIRHYQESLGAVFTGFGTRMFIEEEAFKRLIKKYYKEG